MCYTSDKSYMSLFSNKHLGLALLLFLLLASLSSKSIALSSTLYEAMVPVPTSLPSKPQAELIQEGFKTVLVQISGSEKTLAAPAVKRALESVDGYITRYSYKEDADKKRFLRVKFDEDRINELLRRSNAPILDEARPSTTVWLVVARDEDNPRWVSGESESEIFKQLNTDAKMRAIPLLFPLLDLADTEKVSEKTVWSDDFKTLQSVSSRYNADVLWVGKLSKQKSGWHGQWTLIANGKPQTWDNTNENIEHLCRDAMDELARRLARAMQAHSVEEPLYMQEQYSIPDPTIINPPVTDSPNSPRMMKSRSQVSRFRLSVAGIKEIEQYSKLQAYLKTLPGVKDVEVTLVNPDETIFDVVSLSDRQTLINAIAEGRVLLENRTPIVNSAPATEYMENGTDIINPNVVSETIAPEKNINPAAANITAAEASGSKENSIDPSSEPAAINTGPQTAIPAEDNGILNYKMAEVL